MPPLTPRRRASPAPIRVPAWQPALGALAVAALAASALAAPPAAPATSNTRTAPPPSAPASTAPAPAASPVPAPTPTPSFLFVAVGNLAAFSKALAASALADVWRDPRGHALLQQRTAGLAGRALDALAALPPEALALAGAARLEVAAHGWSLEVNAGAAAALKAATALGRRADLTVAATAERLRVSSGAPIPGAPLRERLPEPLRLFARAPTELVAFGEPERTLSGFRLRAERALLVAADLVPSDGAALRLTLPPKGGAVRAEVQWRLREPARSRAAALLASAPGPLALPAPADGTFELAVARATPDTVWRAAHGAVGDVSMLAQLAVDTQLRAFERALGGPITRTLLPGLGPLWRLEATATGEQIANTVADAALLGRALATLAPMLGAVAEPSAPAGTSRWRISERGETLAVVELDATTLSLFSPRPAPGASPPSTARLPDGVAAQRAALHGDGALLHALRLPGVTRAHAAVSTVWLDADGRTLRGELSLE